MCSHPIVQDAQLLRATRRRPATGSAPGSAPGPPSVSSPTASAASFSAPSHVAAWKFLVGSVLIALKASRLASVPSSRYFAVAGPNDRARRSLAAARTASGSAVAIFPPARTAVAFRFFGAPTPPPPPPPAG